MRHPQSLALLLTAVALPACAHSAEAAPPARTPASATAIPAGQTGQPVVASEAAALEAAKAHPIAHPEPRPLYPDQAPPARPPHGLPDQAPPPRERGLPEQAPPPRDPVPD